jgi:hypothetical protein
LKRVCHRAPPLLCKKKSSYVTSEIFVVWMEDYLLPRKPGGKVLIVLAGHSSHVSDTEIVDLGHENDMVLLCLHSHSTHYLQPLDRTSSSQALLP